MELAKKVYLLGKAWFYSKSHEHRPQQAAAEANPDHRVWIKLDRGDKYGRCYTTFKDYDDFLDYYCNHEHDFRCFFSINRSDSVEQESSP